MNGFIAFMLIRCTQKTGTPTALPHIVSAPESALGSHPCVALSSAQVNSILHQVETLPKGRFLLEATNPISGRFLLEATGPFIQRGTVDLLKDRNTKKVQAKDGLKQNFRGKFGSVPRSFEEYLHLGGFFNTLCPEVFRGNWHMAGTFSPSSQSLFRAGNGSKKRAPAGARPAEAPV